MLWWLIGLWLASPALVPLFWLFGLLAQALPAQTPQQEG
jgi:hypothetical protein